MMIAFISLRHCEPVRRLVKQSRSAYCVSSYSLTICHKLFALCVFQRDCRVVPPRNDVKRTNLYKFLKYPTVCPSPSSIVTFGSHESKRFAFEISGRLRIGSSSGNASEDRKSTRLNSSHTVISYA